MAKSEIADFGVEDPELDYEAANNPSPLAKAIQMPLPGNYVSGICKQMDGIWVEDEAAMVWINRVINAYVKAGRNVKRVKK